MADEKLEKLLAAMNRTIDSLMNRVAVLEQQQLDNKYSIKKSLAWAQNNFDIIHGRCAACETFANDAVCELRMDVAMLKQAVVPNVAEFQTEVYRTLNGQGKPPSN